MSGSDDDAVGALPETAVANDTKKLSEEERKLLVEQMLSMKETLQTEMVSLEAKLSGIRNAMESMKELEYAPLVMAFMC